MTATSKKRSWTKSIDARRLTPILVVLLLSGHAAAAEYRITLTKVAESLDGHSTTRTTVRRVFHHDGYWYALCGDVRNQVYCNFFVTSKDGVHWSDRRVGRGGGVAGGQFGAPNLPETAIVYGDQIYGCYSQDGDLCIRSGTLARGDIAWTQGHTIAPTYVDKTTRDFYHYYPDIMFESDGRISISLRHARVAESSARMDAAYVVSTNPNDITSWQLPRDLITFELPERSDAHENITLPGGRRVVIVRSHRGATDEELYKPGWPGTFYAFHFDGTAWREPVSLGDSDGISGSDKRLSAMLDPGTGIVHLAYVADSGEHANNALHYRTLSPPYGVKDWAARKTIATNVFTVMLGMDASTVPARVAAVYGDQLHEGGEVDPIWGSRWHTGKLYLKWLDGTHWEAGRQLLSESNDEYAWFPSIQQDVSGTFGVLYMHGGFRDFRNTPKKIMFALVEPDE